MWFICPILDWQALQDRFSVPIVTFGALGGRSRDEWASLGISLVIDPFTPQVLALGAVKNAYEGFMKNGDVGTSTAEIFELYNQLDEIAGFDELYAIEDATSEQDK